MRHDAETHDTATLSQAFCTQWRRPGGPVHLTPSSSKAATPHPMAAIPVRRSRPAHVRAGRDEQGGRAAHARARARYGRWPRGRAGHEAATSRPSSRSARCAPRSTAGRGPSLFRLGACELLRSAFLASRRGLDVALALSYFAELLDAFAQEGEAEDAVYRLAHRGGAGGGGGDRHRRADAISGGMAPEAPRHLSAHWIAARAAARRCRRAALRYHAPAHGFVCERLRAARGADPGRGTRSLLAERLPEPARRPFRWGRRRVTSRPSRPSTRT